MFWFHGLPFLAVLGSRKGGEGRHSRRTWGAEEERWSSWQDSSLSLSPPRFAVEKSTCFPCSLLAYSHSFSHSFCSVLLDLVNYRSSSDRCLRFFFFLFCFFVRPTCYLRTLPPPVPLSRSAGPAPGPAALQKVEQFFLPPLSLFLFFFPLCAFLPPSRTQI